MTRSRRGLSTTDRLRDDILNGDFAAGTRLIELQLTDRYGVGRATIRSAIVELDKEGLVTRETNRGATVRAFSVEEAIQVYEARAALEGLMAARGFLTSCCGNHILMARWRRRRQSQSQR